MLYLKYRVSPGDKVFSSDVGVENKAATHVVCFPGLAIGICAFIFFLKIWKPSCSH